VKIVAIDAESGRVYYNHAERGEVAPIAAAMNPNPQPPGPGEAQLEEVETYFNMDLRAQLGLPAHGASYAVFLWLDELTSTVRRVELPGGKREGAAGEGAADASAAGLSFRRTEWTPKVVGTRIVLRPAVGTQVCGALSPALLSSSPSRLTVLALDYRSRILKWRSFPLPKPVLERREDAFDFDALGVFGEPGWTEPAHGPQKIFVTVSVDEALSNVVVISPRKGKAQ
jgi:hypothetical protein